MDQLALQLPPPRLETHLSRGRVSNYYHLRSEALNVYLVGSTTLVASVGSTNNMFRFKRNGTGSLGTRNGLPERISVRSSDRQIRFCIRCAIQHDRPIRFFASRFPAGITLNLQRNE